MKKARSAVVTDVAIIYCIAVFCGWLEEILKFWVYQLLFALCMLKFYLINRLPSHDVLTPKILGWLKHIFQVNINQILRNNFKMNKKFNKFCQYLEMVGGLQIKNRSDYGKDKTERTSSV